MRSQADAAWGLYDNKPRVSGAWVTGITASLVPATVPTVLPMPTTPIVCVTGTNPRRLARFTFHYAVHPNLDANGWAVREMVVNADRTKTVSSAPSGKLCLYNWPLGKDSAPVLAPDDEQTRLFQHIGEWRGGVFVSVLVITESAAGPSTLRRIGMTVKSRTTATLGDVLGRIQAATPSVNGAWQGLIVGRDSMKTMVSASTAIVDDDAVHVFDVSKTFAWVCTDWAPPVAVSVDPADAVKMLKVSERLREVAYRSLAGICDDSTPLPKPEVCFSVCPVV